MKKTSRPFKSLSEKTCPECGEPIKELTESYFMECERCLTKKSE
ncbi:YhfH family protein [Salipaludibacillus sp. LMS25]|nr:protein YhfH [Salipaludibacillus sp. LMS25]UTR16489.1 YhfH family protein [Salipaludibacillus sp. LMS25]